MVAGAAKDDRPGTGVNPIEIMTDELRRAAQQLTNTSEDTDTVLAGFVSRVEGMGMPWGDDLLGMAVGTIYQAAMQLILDAVRSNLDTIDGLSQRLGVAAQSYDMADADQAAKLSSIPVADATI
jgi:hypothetical protein